MRKLVKIYADMIISKLFKFENVPAARKSDVEQELLDRGYDTNGDKMEVVI